VVKWRACNVMEKLEQVAELQYGKLPQLEAKLKEAARLEENKPKNRFIAHPGRRRRNCRSGESLDRHSVSKMLQGERDKLLHMETNCTVV